MPRNQGWEIALSPGPLDLAAARTAIRAEMATELAPDVVEFMVSKLRIASSKYSATELEEVRSQIDAIRAETGWNLAWGIGCSPSSDWRVLITRFAVEETPDVVAETEAEFARFGDMVRLSYCDCVVTLADVPAPAWTPQSSAPPARAPTASAIRVGDYVKRPVTSRCIRGRVLTVSVKAGAKSVRLSAAERHASGTRARLALKTRITRVNLTVTLADGRTASQTLTFRRC